MHQDVLQPCHFFTGAIVIVTSLWSKTQPKIIRVLHILMFLQDHFLFQSVGIQKAMIADLPLHHLEAAKMQY
jgi:hypothetical protein